jgi:hypothetical protein
MKQLSLGSTGSEVRVIQTVMGIKADGVFGPLTERAVERFQLSKNIEVTGIVTSDVWILMFNANYDNTEAIDQDTDISEEYFSTNYDQTVHRHYLPKDEYIKGPIKNDYVVLHHTAGNANPYACIDYWARDSRGRIATEFVLGGQNHRNGNNEFDGVMVQAFPDGCQGWHLGRTGSGFMNRHSVGLEICNMGYLDINGNSFRTYVGSKCIESQICTLKEPFKGKLHWHKYSDKQIEETEKWIRYVGERDEIDIRLGLKEFILKYGPLKAFGFQQSAFYGNIKGLLTHGNVRKDKVDCYPNPDLVDMILSL